MIEAASNDGYMLRVFAGAGIQVLGVDPGTRTGRGGIEHGVPTIVDFFCQRVARDIVADGRRADLLLGNNVLNLVPEPSDFAQAVDVC